VDNIMQMKKF